MIEIELAPTSSAHDRPVRRVCRLQPSDDWIDVHHIYDFNGTYGYPQGDVGWRWGEEEYDEEEGEYFFPTPWAASAYSSDQDWAYVFYFDDCTMGAVRVSDVVPALRALGYDVDRRGDA